MHNNSKALILTGTILAMLLSSLDQTIVSTAMPQIVSQLNGLSHLSWVFTAYMLASTITVPIYGKLSDIFGRRGLFIVGILIFLAGSAFSGLAQNMTQLILFRGLQGIGAGAMMVNSLSIIGDIFPPAERARWQGLLNGVFGLASIAGPLLGGFITDHFSWRWVFYVNLPLGAIAIAVLLSALPKIQHDVKTRSIDFVGASLITLGLVPLLLGFVWGGSTYAWDSWQIIGLFAFAVIVLLIFGLVEHRVREPILSLNLFRNRTFAISAASMFLTSMGMFGAILYIPLFAQGVVGVSATNSGLVMVPLMLAMIATSTLSGQIITRTGRYKVMTVTGMAVATVGMYLFSGLSTSMSGTALAVRMVVLGAGLGIVMPVFTLAVQNAFGVERLGEVTAGSQLFRSIGGTVGTAILGGLMNSQLAARLADVGNDPFVTTIKQVNPAAAIGKIDGNTIQGLLGPTGKQQMTSMIASAPPAYQSQLQAGYNHLLDTVRTAFTGSIDHLFLVGAFILAAGLVITIFLPEVPLRRSNKRVEK